MRQLSAKSGHGSGCRRLLHGDPWSCCTKRITMINSAGTWVKTRCASRTSCPSISCHTFPQTTTALLASHLVQTTVMQVQLVLAELPLISVLLELGAWRMLFDDKKRPNAFKHNFIHLSGTRCLILFLYRPLSHI